MSSTGYRLPSGYTQVSGSWTTPANLYGAGNASISIAAKSTTYELAGTNFGFSTAVLPDGAKIEAVSLQVNWYESSSSNAQEGVQAYVSATALTSHNASRTSLTQDTYDITSERSWAASDFRDDTFTVRCRAMQANTSSSRTYYFDYVQVNVTWSYDMAANATLSGGAPTFGTPGLVQNYTLAALNGVLSGGAPVFGTPECTENTVPPVSLPNATNLANSAPEFGTPELTQNYTLPDATSFTNSAPVFGTPDLIQNHVLPDATSLTNGAPVFGTPECTENISGPIALPDAVSLTNSAPIIGTSNMCPVPVVLLDFGSAKVLVGDEPNSISSYLTNSCASGGYVENADGTLQWVATNTLRISKNRTNLCCSSQDFSNGTYWWWGGGLNTPTANYDTAPDGTETANLLAANSSNQNHMVGDNGSAITSGAVYACTVYMKKVNWSYVYLNWQPANTTGTYATVVFNLDTLAATQTAVGTSSEIIDASAQQLVDGWIRLSLVASINDTAADFSFGFAGSATGNSIESSWGGVQFTASGTEQVLAWGAQYEAGAVSPYIPTTSSPVTILGKGLLVEESRTNLLRGSNDFGNATYWPLGINGNGSVSRTSNAAIAPDGTLTASVVTIYRDANNWWASIWQEFTGTVAVHTGSIYIRAHNPADVGKIVDLVLHDGVSVVIKVNITLGAKWQRVPVVNTLTTDTDCTLYVGWFDVGWLGGVSTDIGTAEFELWGGQVELGAFATSLIPTTTAPAARNADAITITGTAADVLAGTAGTVSVYVDAIPAGWTCGLFSSIGDGYAMYMANGQFGWYRATWGGLIQSCDVNVSTSFFNQPRRAAFGFDASGRTTAVNNTSNSDDLNEYGLIYTDFGIASADTYFKQLTLWSSRLSDTELRAITANDNAFLFVWPFEPFQGYELVALNLIGGAPVFGTPSITPPATYNFAALTMVGPNILDDTIFTGTLGAGHYPMGWTGVGDSAGATLIDPSTVNGITTYAEQIRETATGDDQGLQEDAPWDPLQAQTYRISSWLRIPTGVTASNCTISIPKKIQIDLSGPNLPSELSLLRASSATYFDSSGIIHLASSDMPRFDYDPETLDYRGLLVEKSMTNLLLNSLLDGTNLSTQDVSVTSQNYGLSFYGSGTITLSGPGVSKMVEGSPITNERTRYSFQPSSSGTLTLTVSGTVKWSQLEALAQGDVISSFIPTAGSPVTREGDYVTFLGAAKTALQSTTGVSVVVTCMRRGAPWSSGDVIGPDTAGGMQLADNTSGTNYAYLGPWGSANLCDAGIAMVYESVAKLGGAWAPGDYAICLDGYTVGTGSSGTFVSATDYYLGSGHVSGSHSWFNGWFKDVTVYPNRISNADLKAATALPQPPGIGDATPHGAAALGYTTKVWDVVPDLDDIAPDWTSDGYAFYDGIYFDSTPANKGRYFMSNGVLAMRLSTGGCLSSQKHHIQQEGTLPYLDGASGFYVEFDISLSTDHGDHWPAVWLMPWEHDLSADDQYPDSPFSDPSGYERWWELDVDEGGFGNWAMNSSGDWQGYWANSPTGGWGYWRDPPDYTVWGCVWTNNPSSWGWLDRTQKHTFGASYDPVQNVVRYYLDDRLFAGPWKAPDIAPYQHYYAICSINHHGSLVDYDMRFHRLRAYIP